MNIEKENSSHYIVDHVGDITDMIQKVSKACMIRIFLVLCLLLTGCSKETPKLNIYIWGDFIQREVIEEFERRYSCKVVIDTYDSNESMYAKLKNGASGYDLIFPSGYTLEVMEAQGLLHSLDLARIPNFKNIDWTPLELLNEGREQNAIPYALTFSGVAYRKDKIEEPVSSWTIFDRSDLKGRMTLLNDMREVMGAALRTKGFSINTTNPEEIEAAKNVVTRWKKNVAKFESEQYKNGIASAEYLVIQGYSSDIYQIIEEDEDVGLILPMEGSVFSCDYAAILKDTSSVDLSYNFLNFILEPEIAAKNMEANLYLSPNKPAYALLSDELRNNPALFPPKEFIEKSESLRDLGPAIRLYHTAWSEIKGSR